MSLEDKAQELELAVWEHNNRPRGEDVRFGPGDAGYGPEECEECGEVMPTKRREYGFRLCTDCKSAQERPGRRW